MTVKEACRAVNTKYPGKVEHVFEVPGYYVFAIRPEGKKGRIYGGMHKISKDSGRVTPFNPAFPEDMALFEKREDIELKSVV